MSDAVIYELRSHVARITLNRPEAGNVVNLENLELLYAHLDSAENDADCRAVVIEGRDGVFSRGMDFGFMLAASNEGGIASDFGSPYQKAVLKIRNLGKPVIAAVDGEVLAGGAGIALACDIVVATERSTFGLSEVLFGIIPAYVLPLLLERVSFKRARYMVLSSRKFTAEEAMSLGAFDEVVPDGALTRACTAHLKRLLFSSPEALAAVKSYTDDIHQKDMGEAMNRAAMQLSGMLRDKKNIDAIKAFIDGDMMPWAVKYKRKERNN